VAGAACLTSTLGDPAPTIGLGAVASFCRLTIFDQRGGGRSDPLPDGGPVALMAATTHPERFAHACLRAPTGPLRSTRDRPPAEPGSLESTVVLVLPMSPILLK